MTSGEREREAHVAEEHGGAAAPRTLAAALRGRDDEALAALLRARPDLLAPVPGDLTQLATRAGTRASVVRALERLDRFALQTAEALAVAPDPAPYGVLLALMAGDGGDDEVAAALPRAVGALRDQALVWGGDDRLRLVRTARELLTPSPQHPSPTGLGPTVAEATSGMSPQRLQEILQAVGLPSTHDPVSAVTALSALFSDRERMAALLDEAPVEALAVLDRLVWGPPYGEVTASPTPPVRWLRDRGLLLPASARMVVLPREAALHLRGGRAHREPQPRPPAVGAAREYRPQVVDSAAAGQAHTALATVEELLKAWDRGGPPVLRAGGMAVRDLRRTAALLDASERVAAFWVELAYGAGLLASDGEADERYAPTPAYDEWRDLPAARRWVTLAEVWLAATRTAGLVGGQDAKGRTLSALGPDLDRGAAPEVRRRVLELLAALPAGGAPEAEAVLARLRWERPLRGQAQGTGAELRARLATWTLEEAELLGVTGRGALSAHGRAVVEAVREERRAAAVGGDRAGREADAVVDPTAVEPVGPAAGAGRETGAAATGGTGADALAVDVGSAGGAVRAVEAGGGAGAGVQDPAGAAGA
ncbi:DNA-binding protein, partial [Streptomyces sp. CC77]|uniref:DNA-binding protein n=1 Tax=Streptomyces sp. CC77 TaxID=1906739 RepID=UPI000A9D56C3